jgi:UDP-2,3-diacylglucosamine pyrophosphatase LpxH
MNFIKYHSIWVSDFHLGTHYCKADQLLSFLNNHSADNWYLVGDILDTWNLGSDWYLSKTQELIIDYIRMLAKTSNLTLLSGNHDEPSIGFLTKTFLDIPILEACEYTTLDKRKLLVAHGHQFDASLIKASSDFHFSLAMNINKWYHSNNKIQSIVGKALYSTFGNPRMSRFYKNITKALLISGYTGIVTGHIHRPRIKDLGNGLTYYNDGDWVGSCTALVETLEGELKLVKW